MVSAARLVVALALPLACAFPSTAFAARLDCRVFDVSPAARSLKIGCTVADIATPAGSKLELRFADEFAGITSLSERIFALKAKAVDGRALRPEILGGGIYRLVMGGAREIALSYELRLSRPLDPGQYALVSSLGPEAGFILLADALPTIHTVSASGEARAIVPAATTFRLSLPEGWKAATTEAAIEGQYFQVADVQQAVFFVGQVRERTAQVGRMQLTAALAGTWSFSDEQTGRLAEAIAREQAAMIGGQEQGRFLVALAPFPLPLTGLRSTALTRGRTVILLLNPDSGNDAAARTLKHFQKHLAHEMFHFYLPGVFRIGENFDWFWEGFTRYTAMVTLLRLKLMDARDYLDALGEEYEAYAANPVRAETSLIAASAGKFASGKNYDLIYRKGTLVAALYDLSLRWQSGGKRSVADVVRALYQNFAHAEREVGNQEVTGELSRAGDFKRFVADYISGTREIDLAASVKPYGWLIEQSAATRGRTRLSVAAKLSDKQRLLLSSLTQ